MAKRCKEDITGGGARHSISSESLKRVDIRLDFSGVIAIDNWVERLVDDLLGNIFPNSRISEVKSVMSDLGALQVAADIVGYPVDKFARMPVYIFDNGKLENLHDSLRLSISETFVELTVSCNGYKGIDPYLEFIGEVSDSLLSAHRMAILRRFAIRKLNGFMDSDFDKIRDSVNIDMFLNKALPLDEGYETEYKDFYRIKNLDMAYVRDSRLFRVGRQNDMPVYQAILDLEGSLDFRNSPAWRRPNKKNLIEIAQQTNDILLGLFLQVLTEEYISSHTKS
ncbi:MAG: hypothetical protein K2L35_03280 [Muribaculaceae bacterium]|nr:hypothetical protein [Muribaculaceae bacterium]MDE6447322.1 hypothetical protein [Muribaculaceae bacterium]